MSTRDHLVYALVGLSAWLNGAIAFHLGGRILFENGPIVTALVAAVIALLVCLVFRATFAWRKGRASDAVTVAVIMALPGLFGETARQMVFPWATGLPAAEAPTFAAVIFFGNAVLLTYALIVGRRAD
jgi:ABC-type transport system involved in cytochrome bd biosynthesis fused ATPase/permease subunit